MTVGIGLKSIGDLGKAAGHLPTQTARIFNLKTFDTHCLITPELDLKYGASELQKQTVISVQQRWTNELTWWNPARKNKPQNFKNSTATATVVDPTNGGGPGRCDFCEPDMFTATDTFGRIQAPNAVSASNLFKYVGPHQGVVLFKKHHDPLHFNLEQFADVLAVSHEWFHRASQETAKNSTSSTQQQQKQQLHRLLVWNCLGRAGASQFHGHVQVLQSGVPLPTLINENSAKTAYATHFPGRNYHTDNVEAHAAIGLARNLTWLGSDDSTSTAHVFASLCPYKDAEIVIHGTSLTCPSFQVMLFCALRTLIDELGIQTFNVGIHNIDDNGTGINRNGPVIARVVGRGKLTSAASDFGGLEVFGGASIGHTDPFLVISAFDEFCSKRKSLSADMALAAERRDGVS